MINIVPGNEVNVAIQVAEGPLWLQQTDFLGAVYKLACCRTCHFMKKFSSMVIILF